MLITPFLCIVLGLSLGVAITLIYLQEKFAQKRKRVRALVEAEKAKAQNLLKELDSKWEQETAESTREKEDAFARIAKLEKAVQMSEIKITELKKTVSADDVKNNNGGAAYQTKTGELKRSLKEKEAIEASLLKEKNKLLETLTEERLVISDLHAEVKFLKEEIRRIENDGKKREQDKDYFVMTPGKYIIPGSVARALMNKNKKE